MHYPQHKPSIYLCDMCCDYLRDWAFNASQCNVKSYTSGLKPLFNAACLLLTTQCLARLDGGSSLAVKRSEIIQPAVLQKNGLNLDIYV
jgi:hypothetical protein